MRKIFFLFVVCFINIVFAQESTKANQPFSFAIEKSLAITTVKSQGLTGTCWCFSGTSFIESQTIKSKSNELDISEMFTVRNIYIEKAKNYVLRIGNTRFDEGGLGHDLIRAIDLYGAMPENVYTGLQVGVNQHNHQNLKVALKAYLDSIIKQQPVANDWLIGFTQILDNTLGIPPNEFEYNGKKYTPKSFAKEVLNFNATDYVNITSFTHQPYYQPFVLQVPDNFSNGQYYNIPLDEMIMLTKNAVTNGFTVLWDADVSNNGFMQDRGFAININLSPLAKYDMRKFNPDSKEEDWNATKRQELYENLTTQDDHLMHIYGIEKTALGKTFFQVKNSWGKIGPYSGSINVSEAYFAINTVSLIVPKAAIPSELLLKLHL